MLYQRSSNPFPVNDTTEGGTARLMAVILLENGLHVERSQVLYDLQEHSWYKLLLPQHHETGKGQSGW